MLRRLSISNYALIDTLDIEFGEGLSIITGDTGAGKSVMMGALGLLTGGRADFKIFAQREGKAVIEADFDKADPALQPVFDKLSLDWNEGNVIVRREITSSGRSRAFINDTPVNLLTLEEIASRLIDIHSQHSNRLLSLPTHQLWIIDAMGNTSDILNTYRTQFKEYVKLRSAIKRRKEAIEKNKENRDYILYRLEILNKLNPKRGELKEIEKQFDRLSDADQLRTALGNAARLIGAEEASALSLMADAGTSLDQIDLSLFEDDNDSENHILSRLGNLYVELKDIYETLQNYSSDIQSDPIRLEKITRRMNDYYDVAKQMHVSGDGLVDLKESLQAQLHDLEGGDESIQHLEEEARRLGKELKKTADLLTEKRIAAATKFSAQLTKNARPLGLKNLIFNVYITKGKLTPDGQDILEFQCAFNKNQQLMPMAKVASGGEMARLTLCIKGIVAGRMKLPTVIFDEIDTGVSGEIADKMGEMMAHIASDMQVIAITHLPQVAAKGANHYMVYKKDLSDRTVSNVKKLDTGQRISELARMLSGSKINEAAIENAKVLLGN